MGLRFEVGENTNKASEGSTSVVWSSSHLSDEIARIATCICSRSAEYATPSQNRTWAATAINTHIHTSAPAPARGRATLKISARTLRDCRSDQESVGLSIMEGLRRSRREEAQGCVPIDAGHRCTNANGFHALSCCVRAHGWHVAGAGEVVQEYGKKLIGRDDEWAMMWLGMSFSNPNGMVRVACNAGTWSS